MELLPCCRPLCKHDSIIGHGTRRKQAHDQRRDWIQTRRGLCMSCGKTFTILRLWSLLRTQYSLICREQTSCEYESCRSVEQAALYLFAAGFIAFASGLASLRFELISQFRLPTIFAGIGRPTRLICATEALSP